MRCSDGQLEGQKEGWEEGSPNALGKWPGRGLVGPIDEEGIHDSVPQEESGVVGWNEAEGRSKDIAMAEAPTVAPWNST